MIKPWQKYEETAELVYRILYQKWPQAVFSRNSKIETLEGKREIDILVSFLVGQESIRIAIECKDYSRPVNISVIDAFHSKMKDCKISKGVIVSRRGFSKSAAKKAKRLGITVCRLDHLSSFPESPLNILPVFIRKIDPLKKIAIKLKLGEQGRADTLIKPLTPFSDMSLKELLKMCFNTAAKLEKAMFEEHFCIRFSPEIMPNGLWISTKSGYRLSIDSAIISFQVNSRTRMTSLAEFENVIQHENNDFGSRLAVFSADELPNVWKKSRIAPNSILEQVKDQARLQVFILPDDLTVDLLNSNELVHNGNQDKQNKPDKT